MHVKIGVSACAHTKSRFIKLVDIKNSLHTQKRIETVNLFVINMKQRMNR